jgi:hypothetical protein
MNSTLDAGSGLYAWSKDLEASRDVSEREQAAYAMLLGSGVAFSYAGTSSDAGSC